MENGIPEINNTILKNEIAAFSKDPNTENSVSLLHCMHQSLVFVPGKIEADGSVTPNGQKNIRFTPTMIKNKNGINYFPVLTSRDEAPIIKGKKIGGLTIPFKTACDMTDKRTDCNAIMINPFSDKFIVPEHMYKNVLRIGAASSPLHEKRIMKGENVMFFGPEQGDSSIKDKAKKAFIEYPCILKAYFTRMIQGGQMSYLFIMETENDFIDYRDMFAELAKKIGTKDLRLPLTFALKNTFVNIEGNEKIKLIYTKNTGDTIR